MIMFLLNRQSRLENLGLNPFTKIWVSYRFIAFPLLDILATHEYIVFTIEIHALNLLLIHIYETLIQCIQLHVSILEDVILSVARLSSFYSFKYGKFSSTQHAMNPK